MRNDIFLIVSGKLLQLGKNICTLKRLKGNK